MEIDKDYFELQKQKQRSSLLKSVGFYNKIDYFYELIDRLSQMNFESIRFINHKRKILCQSIGMNTTLYSLKGIKSLCEIGNVIDAFTLLRKIRDNLYLDLFFISESINNKPKNYESSKSFGDMTDKELYEEVMRYASFTLSEEENNTNVQNISSWFDGVYSSDDKKRIRTNCFSFKKYKDNIEEKNDAIKECHDKYLKTLFNDLNNNLNNYVHSNGPSFLSNDKINMNSNSFINAIKDLIRALEAIKRVFMIDLYLIDSTMFRTDDYMDAFEMAIEPVEGSQYEAIYQIVEEFENIDKEDHELYIYLKNNNQFLMKCFYDSI